MYDWQGEGEMT